MKDTQFMTAKEKELVLQQWQRFIKTLSEDTAGNDKIVTDYGGEIPRALFKKFTDRIYKHLTLHCSFIAHYDRAGFFGTYFVTGDDIVKFISQFDKDTDYKSIEYGACWWINDSEYKDLNTAMCEVVEQYKKRIYKKYNQQQEEADISQAEVLLARHGIGLKR